jgi:hypothetical protein
LKNGKFLGLGADQYDYSGNLEWSDADTIGLLHTNEIGFTTDLERRFWAFTDGWE